MFLVSVRARTRKSGTTIDTLSNRGIILEAMPRCAYCKTDLHEGGVPICQNCLETTSKRKPPTSGREIQAALINHIAEATARVNAANEKFSAAMSHFPSGLAHPDGVQRLKNASHKLDVARKEMLMAHTRLNDFVELGIVPEDLKRSG
jgi:hypothetical protein